MPTRYLLMCLGLTLSANAFAGKAHRCTEADGSVVFKQTRCSAAAKASRQVHVLDYDLSRADQRRLRQQKYERAREVRRREWHAKRVLRERATQVRREQWRREQWRRQSDAHSGSGPRSHDRLERPNQQLTSTACARAKSRLQYWSDSQHALHKTGVRSYARSKTTSARRDARIACGNQVEITRFERELDRERR